MQASFFVIVNCRDCMGLIRDRSSVLKTEYITLNSLLFAGRLYAAVTFYSFLFVTNILRLHNARVNHLISVVLHFLH